jgi:hypothetical protein
MDNFRKHQRQRPSGTKLVRGADGRLHPATGHSDIGDLWAEQSRIRLADAIQNDRRKSEKKGRLKKGFGEFAVNVRLPKIKMPKITALASKKPLTVGLAALVLVTALGTASYLFANSGAKTNKAGDVLTSESESLFGQEPAFKTVLPGSKSIEELGGWARVSPPDRDPVFAYVDSVDGVKLNVSQQPLPDNLRQDTAGEAASLAEQFNADKQLEASNLTLHVGMASSGEQSVIFAKGNLLVLIRSAAELPDARWVAYVETLQY